MEYDESLVPRLSSLAVVLAHAIDRLKDVAVRIKVLLDCNIDDSLCRVP